MKVIFKTVPVCASECVYCSVIPESLSLKQKKYRKKGRGTLLSTQERVWVDFGRREDKLLVRLLEGAEALSNTFC